MAALSRLTSLPTTLALSPALTATLLYILTTGPPSLRTRLAQTPIVSSLLSSPSRHASIIRTLKFLLALGLARHVNRALNVLALNTWRLRAETERWGFDSRGRKGGKEGEVAVVTGGCSGIGALIVKGLVGRGVRVAVLDVRGLPEELQGCMCGYFHFHTQGPERVGLLWAHADIKFYNCDITDPDAVFSTATQIKSALGAPSILINNAGILSAHTILATKHSYLRKIFDVNVLSNWTTVQAFLPDMIAQNKGHVVTVASGASYVGVAGLADYTATKAAVLSFHEGLNQEIQLSYKAPGILTTSIHPGWVRTPLLEPVIKELEKGGAAVMEPQDVANAVLKQVFGCRGAQVFLPESSGKGALIRALPNWMQEGVRKGISKTITESVEIGGM